MALRGHTVPLGLLFLPSELQTLGKHLVSITKLIVRRSSASFKPAVRKTDRQKTLSLSPELPEGGSGALPLLWGSQR